MAPSSNTTENVIQYGKAFGPSVYGQITGFPDRSLIANKVR